MKSIVTTDSAGVQSAVGPDNHRKEWALPRPIPEEVRRGDARGAEDGSGQGPGLTALFWTWSRNLVSLWLVSSCSYTGGGMNIKTRLKKLGKIQKRRKPVSFFWGEVEETVRERLEKNGRTVIVVRWIDCNEQAPGPLS